MRNGQPRNKAILNIDIADALITLRHTENTSLSQVYMLPSENHITFFLKKNYLVF